MNRQLLISSALACIVLGCARSTEDVANSQTHWLQSCKGSAECGSLSCVCGVCVAPCTDANSCDVPGRQTACKDAESEPSRALCENFEPKAVCLESCRADSCPLGQICLAGACVPSRLVPAAGAGGAGDSGRGGAGMPASSGAGGTAGAASCGALPQCDFQCAQGTVNPVDAQGCTHTCECVTAPGKCDSIPQCEFACPDGTQNPIGSDGCTYTCECNVSGSDPGKLKLYYTCGDPACSGHTAKPGVSACASERVGDSCRIETQRCDPTDECNRLLVCASSDPAERPGGCPISRRRFKRDIHYLESGELAQYRDELLALRLATWRYKHDPVKQRLGFIIDDSEGSAAVDPSGDIVDLYGYTSLAVATLQLQAQQIDTLKREVADLKSALKRQRSARASPRDARR